jgi:hypothetical protein
MRICDRCGTRAGNISVTVEIFGNCHKRVHGDLCESCETTLIKFASQIFTSMTVKEGAHNTSPVSEPCASGTDE